MPDKPAFDPNPPDARIEMTLRPALLDQFVGQLRIKERLDVLIGAAKQREDSLEHSALLRTARAGQDVAGAYRREGDGREHHHDFRAR